MLDKLPEEIMSKIEDHLWEPINYRVGVKVFRVLHKTDGTNHWIKPLNEYTDECSHCGTCMGYHFAEYESLFGFGCHCSNFDPSKIVDVTKYFRNT